MCQPRQFALASALSVACQPVAVRAELPVKSALLGIIPALDLSRAMSRQPRRYFAVNISSRQEPGRSRAGPHAAARARDGTHRSCRSSSCRLRTSRTFWLRERAGTSDGGSQRLRERAFQGGARHSILRGNNQVAGGHRGAQRTRSTRAPGAKAEEPLVAAWLRHDLTRDRLCATQSGPFKKLKPVTEGAHCRNSPWKDHDFGDAKGNFMIELTSPLV
jgi:hypothetical protein